MPEPLSTDEFVRWCGHIDDRFDRLEIAHADHDARTLKNTIDIAILKEQRSKATTRQTTISGGVSTLIAAVVSGIAAYFSAKG